MELVIKPLKSIRAQLFSKMIKFLLVQENDGLWSLPGGWIDVLETIHKVIRLKKYAKKRGLMLSRLLLFLFMNNINAIFRLCTSCTQNLRHVRTIKW